MEIEIRLLLVALLPIMILEVRSGFSRNEGGRNPPAESIADTLNNNQRHRSPILEWIGDIMQDQQRNRKAPKQLIGDDMNDIQGTIIPILSDMLCKACLKLEEEKRLNCTKKHCAVTQNKESFPTSDAGPAIFPNIVIGDTNIADSDRFRGKPSFARSKTSHSSFATGSSRFTTGSSSFISSSSNTAGRPTSSSKGEALSEKSLLSQQVHKFVNNGISNKLRPEDRSRVVIAKLIDILCKLCENMNNEKERQECIDKFKCVWDRFAGLNPRKLRNQRKIMKSEVKKTAIKGKSRNRNSKP